jgi:HAE1 family hydrophobic/amphiphilic exporter-1
MDDLRPRLAGLPGAEVRLRADESFIAGGGTGDKIQVELRGNDLAESDRLSRLMRDIVTQVPGVTDVQLSNEDATPEEAIVIDRNRAADAGLSVAQVSNFIKTALGGSEAGNFRNGGKEYAIRVRLKNADQTSIEEIMNLTLNNNRGEQVALANVARAKGGSGPLRINRKDQSRVVTVSADYSGRKLSDILDDIDLELRKLPMSQEFSYAFVGEAKERAETFAGLKVVFILALLLVYMVMACQFEQLKGPLVVMFSVPFGAIGEILILFLTGTTFNLNSFIGIIMLVGIVVSNAILLVDHANLLRRRDRLDLDSALSLAGRRRLRPILMTSLSPILGLVPLALGLGEGGETQAPLARTVIGGLTTSTFITLLVVPAIYKLLKPRVDSEPA